MTIKKRLSGFRKISQYNPTLAHHLANILASEGMLAKACNAGLWFAYHSGVSLIRLKQRIQEQRRALAGRQPAAVPASSSSTTSPAAPIPPWQQDIGASNPVRKGVLILAELSIPQCRRYRVQQKVDGLKMLDEPVFVQSWTDMAGIIGKLQTCRLLILYRTPASREVREVVQEARRLGMPVLFDIDDLVFDVDVYATNSNLLSLSRSEQAELLHGAKLYQQALELADHGIASTPTLAGYMKKFCRGQVHLVENAIDAELLRLADLPLIRPQNDTVTIFYGSGTRTHDKDFAQAETALIAVLERFDNCQLVILGHLNLSDAFDRVAHKVHRIGFIDAADYYQAIRQFSISIAPLEPGQFNDAKSNIKYLEASVFGIPTVASPAAAFKQVIRHGENGFLATNHDEWFDALSHLVSDATLREHLGKQAREDAVNAYALTTIAHTQMAGLLDHSVDHHKPGSKHVLVVNVLFSPISFGGATVVAEQLALQLSLKPNTRVTVLTGTFDGSMAVGELRRYEWNGVNVFAVRMSGNPMDEYMNPVIAEQFGRFVDAIVPDVVHFHSIQHLGASLCEVCSSRKLPYAITLHDAWWLCDRQFMVNRDGFCGQKAIDPVICASCVDDTAASYRRRFYLHKALLGASLFLTPSRYQQALYVKSGLPAERVVVNRNGVLLPQRFRTDTHKQKRAPGKGLVFAFLGGRVAHKGYFWLKEVFESIRTNIPYTLRLVDIESRFGMTRMPSDHWKIAGKLEIVGPFEASGIDAFYDEVDVLLFPSQWGESFGLTIREALARDKWVITTESGGPTEEVVNGENGIIVPMHDQAAFRAAVEQCLSNPDFHVHYRNPHRDVIRGFAEQADELNELLEGVLAEHRRS